MLPVLICSCCEHPGPGLLVLDVALLLLPVPGCSHGITAALGFLDLALLSVRLN